MVLSEINSGGGGGNKKMKGCLNRWVIQIYALAHRVGGARYIQNRDIK